MRWQRVALVLVFSSLTVTLSLCRSLGIGVLNPLTAEHRSEPHRDTLGRDRKGDGHPLEKTTLNLREQSFDKVEAFATSATSFVFALYSAKTSGSTGKTLYRRTGGASDVDNFINIPLHKSSISFKRPQKVLASHYTCAKEQVSRLLRLGKPEMLVLFPFRESTDLIRSAIFQNTHRLCDSPQAFGLDQTFSTNGTCVLPRDILIENVLLPKPFEMAWTHIDCLDFDDLQVTLSITRSSVCFGSLRSVNALLHVLSESHGEELQTVNVNAKKGNISVLLGDLTSVDMGDFIDFNWPKISASLKYNITREHRWLENLLIDYPDAFFCNRDVPINLMPAAVTK